MVQLIYTVGHSTRELEEFILLLQHNGIKTLADIRRFPGSRRHPHFSREALEQSLAAHGIAYLHFETLGGRRDAHRDSPNTALESGQFRGYADHMASPEFHAAVDRLLAIRGRTVVMCAEAVPWRCHRNLLSDDLVRRGVMVVHLIGPGSTRTHEMNPLASVEGDHVVYRGEQGSLFGA